MQRRDEIKLFFALAYVVVVLLLPDPPWYLKQIAIALLILSSLGAYLVGQVKGAEKVLKDNPPWDGQKIDLTANFPAWMRHQIKSEPFTFQVSEKPEDPSEQESLALFEEPLKIVTREADLNKWKKIWQIVKTPVLEQAYVPKKAVTILPEHLKCTPRTMLKIIKAGKAGKLDDPPA